MDKIIEELKSQSWDFKGESTKDHTHNFHPYTAKFIPQIPRKLIIALSKEKDVVFDPFGGSGTTIVEARAIGRKPIMTDINGFSCLIAKVKAKPLSEGQILEIQRSTLQISSQISKIYGQSTIIDSSSPQIGIQTPPKILNMDHWFKPHIIKELTIAKSIMDSIADQDVRDFLYVALASIIVRVSNQESETRYTANCEKNHTEKMVSTLLTNRVNAMIPRIREYSRLFPNLLANTIVADARSVPIENESVDLIVTSPPYLNAWDYHLYHRFRMLWLGYDVNNVRINEIGAHLTHSYDDASVGHYEQDMKQCISEMYRVLKPESYCCIVIGSSIVKGKEIDNKATFESLGRGLGFHHEATINRQVDRRSKSVNPIMGRAKNEDIVILRKVRQC